MFLSTEAVALVSAALRHVRDAEWLAHVDNPRPSLDQAYHLAGYGPECIRKATLQTRDFDKTIHHGFDAAAEDVLALAASLDTFAHRYQPWGWAERYATLSPWSPEHRYERSGTFKDDQVAALLSDARDAVDTVVLALWADGRFPVEATSW